MMIFALAGIFPAHAADEPAAAAPAPAQTPAPAEAPTPTPAAPEPTAAPPAAEAAKTEPAAQQPPATTPEATHEGPKRATRVTRKKSTRGFAAKRPARARGVFLVPLQFDPEDNGLSIENPQFKWVYDPKADSIDFGNGAVEAASIVMNLEQVKRQAAPVKYDVRKTEKWLTTLSMQWPEKFTRTGEVSIETLDGAALWKFTVDENQRKLWTTDFDYATADMKKSHEKAGWGRFDIVPSEFAFLYKGGQFRACLTNEETEAERLKMCSPPFISKSKGDRIKFFPVKNYKIDEPGVYLSNKKLENTGLLNFNVGKALTIAVKFANGSSIEISSQPADPQLLDAVQSPDGKEIILTGAGAQPLGQRVRVIKKPITHFWAPTGIKQEKIWQCAIPADVPTVTVRGAFNLPFTMLFNYDRLPGEEDRVFVEQTRSSGTYGSEPVVNGYVPSAAELSSGELSVEKSDPYTFHWRYHAPNSGAENRARLAIKRKDSDRPWVAHYRMHRSYPGELSGRMTGILEGDYTVLILGEISAARWFETLGGWQHPLLSRQRWGLTARYFRSLTSVTSNSGQSVSDFSVLNVDAKYNLLPGIWHHDELVGLNFSTEMILVAGQTATLMGGGVYWARTMPRVFDDLFNYLPYMEYPKYVDMELIYYPFSLSQGVTGGATVAVNFHGRVFWTRRIYGEVGFGIRRYQFAVPRPNQPGRTSTIDLTTMYGNMGLGFIF